MANFTQLVANSASVVPATSEVVYDKLWMTNLRIMAQNPNQKVRMVAELVPARDVGDTKELMPNASITRVVVNDLFDKAASDASFAAVIDSVIAKIKELGIEQGVIKDS